MNHDCDGDRFIADGQTLYRCFAGGNVTESVPNGQPCPTCMRPVDAADHGALPVSTETTRFVTLNGGRRAVLSCVVAPAPVGEPGAPLPPPVTSVVPRKRKSEWPQRLRHLLLMLVVVAISLYVGTNLERFISMAGEHLHPASSGDPLHPLLTEAEVEGLIDLSPAAIRQCVREKVINEVAKSPAPIEPRSDATSGLTSLTAPQITVMRRLCQEQQSS